MPSDAKVFGPCGATLGLILPFVVGAEMIHILNTFDTLGHTHHRVGCSALAGRGRVWRRERGCLERARSNRMLRQRPNQSPPPHKKTDSREPTHNAEHRSTAPGLEGMTPRRSPSEHLARVITECPSVFHGPSLAATSTSHPELERRHSLSDTTDPVGRDGQDPGAH